MAGKKKQKNTARAHERKTEQGKMLVEKQHQQMAQGGYRKPHPAIGNIAMIVLVLLGIILVGFSLFSLISDSNPGGNLPNASALQPQTPPKPVQVISNGSFPDYYQVVVKNTKNESVLLTSIMICNETYTVSSILQPGEVRTFNLILPECAKNGEYGIELIYQPKYSPSYPPSESNPNNIPSQNPASGENQTIVVIQVPGGDEIEGSGGNDPGEPLAIATDTLIPAKRDVPYSFQLFAIGGYGNYRWYVDDLPAALYANTDGLIQGTPLAPGTFSIRIRVEDGSSQVSTVEAPLVVSGE